MKAQKDLLPSFHLFLAPEAEEEEGEGEGIKNHIAPQTDRTGEEEEGEKEECTKLSFLAGGNTRGKSGRGVQSWLHLI